MTKDELIVLHDRLADVLCVTSGFKMGVNAMTGGNTDQRNALKDYIKLIEDTLRPQKRLINLEISIKEK